MTLEDSWMAEEAEHVVSSVLGSGRPLQDELEEQRRRRESKPGRWSPEDIETVYGIAQDRLDEFTARIIKLEDRGDGSALSGRGHAQWYVADDESKSRMRTWQSYRAYLRDAKQWDEHSVIKSIDDSSDAILASLPSPKQENSFDGRGVVLGYVQSGKTANMTAVVAKAADSGFRAVLVIAGILESLRQQTYARFQSDLLDHDPERWESFTDEVEDFQAAKGRLSSSKASLCRFLVVKKNKSVLEKLIKWIEASPAGDLERFPVLVIDDECDNASVNAGKDSEFNPTTINRLIRQILNTLPQSAYIGYTATPFANVLINPNTNEGSDRPADLYPRDFIFSLPTPTEYFGAARVFGRNADMFHEGYAEDGIDMIRTIPSKEVPMLTPPRGVSVEEFEPEVCESLRRAIWWYLMATAARASRVEAGFASTMMIHTNRLTALHDKTHAMIDRELKKMRAAWANGDNKLTDRLREMWNSEQRKVAPSDFGLTETSFGDVADRFEFVLGRVTLLVENSNYEKGLLYGDAAKGEPWYIVVGGDALSRGLTLEGLVVSYFLRSAGQYDTLLQMGRWFGYRQGYEDLPRIWLTGKTAERFRDLATIEAEIRYDVGKYRAASLSPMDFGVRIRKIPGLAITARNKMRHAKTRQVSYSDEHIQTIRYYSDWIEWIDDNWQALSWFVEKVIDDQTPQTGSAGRLIFDVRCEDVIGFLERYVPGPGHAKFEVGSMRKYIRKENSAGRLTAFNVVFVEPGSGEPSGRELPVLGRLKTVGRSEFAFREEDGRRVADIKALMSSRDLLADVGSNESVKSGHWDEAKAIRQEEGLGEKGLLLVYAINRTSEPVKKSRREPLNAVDDMIGVGILFPDSGVESAVALQVDLGEEDADIVADESEITEESSV